jgi:hypothetical protein
MIKKKNKSIPASPPLFNAGVAINTSMTYTVII